MQDNVDLESTKVRWHFVSCYCGTETTLVIQGPQRFLNPSCLRCDALIVKQ